MGAPLNNTNAATAPTRGRSREMADAIRHALHSYENSDQKVTRGEAKLAIAKKIVENAIDGKLDWIKLILDRVDGKPAQVTDIEVNVNAVTVVQQLVARTGSIEQARAALIAAKASNLLPVLEQIPQQDNS